MATKTTSRAKKAAAPALTASQALALADQQWGEWGTSLLGAQIGGEISARIEKKRAGAAAEAPMLWETGAALAFSVDRELETQDAWRRQNHLYWAAAPAGANGSPYAKTALANFALNFALEGCAEDWARGSARWLPRAQIACVRRGWSEKWIWRPVAGGAMPFLASAQAAADAVAPGQAWAQAARVYAWPSELFNEPLPAGRWRALGEKGPSDAADPAPKRGVGAQLAFEAGELAHLIARAPRQIVAAIARAAIPAKAAKRLSGGGAAHPVPANWTDSRSWLMPSDAASALRKTQAASSFQRQANEELSLLLQKHWGARLAREESERAEAARLAGEAAAGAAEATAAGAGAGSNAESETGAAAEKRAGSAAPRDAVYSAAQSAQSAPSGSPAAGASRPIEGINSGEKKSASRRAWAWLAAQARKIGVGAASEKRGAAQALSLASEQGLRAPAAAPARLPSHEEWVRRAPREFAEGQADEQAAQSAREAEAEAWRMRQARAFWDEETVESRRLAPEWILGPKGDQEISLGVAIAQVLGEASFNEGAQLGLMERKNAAPGLPGSVKALSAWMKIDAFASAAKDAQAIKRALVGSSAASGLKGALMACALMEREGWTDDARRAVASRPRSKEGVLAARAAEAFVARNGKGGYQHADWNGESVREEDAERYGAFLRELADTHVSCFEQQRLREVIAASSKKAAAKKKKSSSLGSEASEAGSAAEEAEDALWAPEPQPAVRKARRL